VSMHVHAILSVLGFTKFNMTPTLVATTGMTVCKAAAAELTPHKLAPFHFANSTPSL